MLKYVMMAGVVAAALTAGSSGAYAKNGDTFFANQPAGCHREELNLGVVKAIWVGCNFKWWGGAFEPGDGASGTSDHTGQSSREENCHPCPPPPKCYDKPRALGKFTKGEGKSFKSFGNKSFGNKSFGKSFGKSKP